MSGTRIIAVHESNMAGKMVITGDIHGRLRTLQHLFSTLSPNDRLYIVGDLIDRGPDSKKILLLLNDMTNHPEKYPNHPKVYTVRGNHEHEALLTINELEETLLDKMTTSPAEGIAAIEDECKSNEQLLFSLQQSMGGAWIIQLFIEELATNKILVDLENDKIIYANDSVIALIDKYLSSLPLIIHCKEAAQNHPLTGKKTRAFHVVHAEMPFDDDTVQKIIRGERKVKLENNGKVSLSGKNTQAISFAEMDYALTARPDVEPEPGEIIIDNGRNQNSILAFGGHSIIQPGKPYRAYRVETNFINTDTGSFHTGYCLAIEMTEEKCYHYSLVSRMKDYVEQLSPTINLHLTTALANVDNSPMKTGAQKRAAREHGESSAVKKALFMHGSSNKDNNSEQPADAASTEVSSSGFDSINALSGSTDNTSNSSSLEQLSDTASETIPELVSSPEQTEASASTSSTTTSFLPGVSFFQTRTKTVFSAIMSCPLDDDTHRKRNTTAPSV